MKIITTLILACLISFTCLAQSTKKGYEIIGDVKNISAKFVYLNVLKRDQNNDIYWPVIDSARVQNGKFSLHKDTILADPAWASSIVYKDSISNKQVQLLFISPYLKDGKPSLHGSFILENVYITISGDLGINKGVTIKGSKETDFNMKYGLIYPPPIATINKRIDSLKNISDTKKLTLLEAERTEIVKNFKRTFKQIITENPSTWAALLNIYQNATYFTPAELEEIALLFDKELMKGPTGQKFKNYIIQSKLLLSSKPFPDFSYNDVTNKKFNLDNLKGKNGTLVVFWASWCGPCRAEIPELKKFYAMYKSKGIALISISTDHNINDWKKALVKEQMSWPNLSNLPGNHKEISSKYNVTSIPAMFLLDKDNKIVLTDPNDFKLVKKETERMLKGI